MNTPWRLWRGYTLRRLAHNNLYPQHIHCISSATERWNFKFAGGLFKHETGLVWRLMCIKYLLYKSRENLISSKFYMAENCSRSTWPSSCATISAFPGGPISQYHCGHDRHGHHYVQPVLLSRKEVSSTPGPTPWQVLPCGLRHTGPHCYAL